jgi:hypothetical protein
VFRPKLANSKLSVTREKLSMAKGKPQQIGMSTEINSIPTYAIYANVRYQKEAYLDPTFDKVPPLSSLTQIFYTCKKFSTNKKNKHIVMI